MATLRQPATPYRAFGESLVLQEGTVALEETKKRGPATDVVFNPEQTGPFNPRHSIELNQVDS